MSGMRWSVMHGRDRRVLVEQLERATRDRSR